MRGSNEHSIHLGPQKAEANRRKHRISFEEALTVLADPLAAR
jgi:uncharacterized DUF497 family protein